uniref:RING-type domain-containing protein n=1 Tax=Branchiostoma floridae TaxID=7739 RepID=C3XXT2_BRAFL|eukprot:XP_002611532.1 hypothetical protein BRAFLDRAFT_63831 [Branchiostoma floridae]
MATASFSEKVSDDFIQCTICCYNFKKPKVLPCLHTFCAHCLQEWVQKNDGNTFPCPTCREQVHLPENGVEGLKDNFFLASLVKAVTEHHKVRHGQDGLLCTTCDEGKPATSRCSECAEFLCESCESAHRLQRATKGHTLFTFEELKTGKYDGVFKTRKAPPCPKHSGEILKLYCRTCETPICNECALFEHRDSQHDLKRIEELPSPCVAPSPSEPPAKLRRPPELYCPAVAVVPSLLVFLFFKRSPPPTHPATISGVLSVLVTKVPPPPPTP